MKKVLVTIAGVICATAICVHADDAADSGKKKSHHKVTPEQKELLEKYDTNKDGKIDKDERSKMTQEDKDKWAKAAGAHKKKKDASQ
jgi:hypothetical protein